MSKNLLIIGLVLLAAATGVVLVVNISQKPPISQDSMIKTEETTKKTGEIKTGAMVEVEEDRGHAKSIKVEESKK